MTSIHSDEEFCIHAFSNFKLLVTDVLIMFEVDTHKKYFHRLPLIPNNTRIRTYTNEHVESKYWLMLNLKINVTKFTI